MLPINLDLARVRVVLVGAGDAACRRLVLLDQAGAADLVVYAAAPDPKLEATAGARLRRRWPKPEEIARAQLVLVAGAPELTTRRIRDVAAVAGVLLNVEDDISRSDFHSRA